MRLTRTTNNLLFLWNIHESGMSLIFYILSFSYSLKVLDLEIILSTQHALKSKMTAVTRQVFIQIDLTRRCLRHWLVLVEYMLHSKH